VAPATLYCLPFDKLRKFGSKVLYPFYIDDFSPGRGEKSSIKEEVAGFARDRLTTPRTQKSQCET
jgi:hypothetical protein